MATDSTGAAMYTASALTPFSSRRPQGRQQRREGWRRPRWGTAATTGRIATGSRGAANATIPASASSPASTAGHIDDLEDNDGFDRSCERNDIRLHLLIGLGGLKQGALPAPSREPLEHSASDRQPALRLAAAADGMHGIPARGPLAVVDPAGKRRDPVGGRRGVRHVRQPAPDAGTRQISASLQACKGPRRPSSATIVLPDLSCRPRPDRPRRSRSGPAPAPHLGRAHHPRPCPRDPRLSGVARRIHDGAAQARGAWARGRRALCARHIRHGRGKGPQGERIAEHFVWVFGLDGAAECVALVLGYGACEGYFGGCRAADAEVAEHEAMGPRVRRLRLTHDSPQPPRAGGPFRASDRRARPARGIRDVARQPSQARAPLEHRRQPRLPPPPNAYQPPRTAVRPDINPRFLDLAPVVLQARPGKHRAAAAAQGARRPGCARLAHASGATLSAAGYAGICAHG
ncbi:hypothetical protein BDK51DRAFT_41018 [Blyttiomyces helicus]|uniref:Uncharacterized protein n=1 Tax=Blyttiomyces helicus TaxID=388810 RepID=A0A4V1IR11_9FUNG|nr:hypothetical protein BDK51DRAFT_41018 [Blyttiomyces helicus]|eukprot:RKO88437.1 hypothetical protein BDK51DRAFT_41018 [Blyttiomyces helicus]